eukprot:6145349-Prymnesium_polylepis.1
MAAAAAAATFAQWGAPAVEANLGAKLDTLMESVGLSGANESVRSQLMGVAGRPLGRACGQQVRGGQ